MGMEADTRRREHIQEYLHQRGTDILTNTDYTDTDTTSNSSEWTVDEYLHWFDKIPDLAELCDCDGETPAYLSLVLPILPVIVASVCRSRQQGQEGLEEDEAANVGGGSHPNDPKEICAVQIGVYDGLVRRWFVKSEVDPDHCQTYSTNLVVRMMQTGKYSMTEEHTLDEALLPGQNSDTIRLVRDSCPLICNGSTSTFQFKHPSILRYFGPPEQRKLAWLYDAHLQSVGTRSSVILGKISSSQPDSASQAVANHTTANQEFKYLLLTIVQKSADNLGLDELAGTALSILNRAQYNFAGQSFQDINAPGANMSGAFCAHTDFRGANLRHADFTQAYLFGCRFEGTDLSHVRFGEEAEMSIDGELRSMYAHHTKTSVQLWSFVAKVDKYFKGRAINRNDRIHVNITDFVTGAHVRTVNFGRIAFGGLQYQHVAGNRLITWPHRDGWTKKPGIRVWDLQTWKYVSVPISRFFPTPVTSTFSSYFRVDQQGKWIAMEFSNNFDHSPTAQHFVLISRLETQEYRESTPIPIQYDVGSEISGRIYFPTDNLLVIESNVLILLLLDGDNDNDNVKIIAETKIASDTTRVNPICTKRILIKVPPRKSNEPSFFNTKTGVVTTFPSAAFSSAVSEMVFNDEMTLVALGDTEGLVHVWSVDPSVHPIRTFTCDQIDGGRIFCFNGNLLACGHGLKKVVKFWEIRDTDSSISVLSVHATNEKKPSHVVAIAQQHNEERDLVGVLYCTQHPQRIGEPDKRQLTLGIWNTCQDGSSSQSQRMRMSKREPTLGTNLGLSFNLDGQLVVMCTTGTNFAKDAQSVLLFYNEAAELVHKLPIEHKEWRGRTTLNYRSALNLVASDSVNLATALWDGSIQLWRLTDTGRHRKLERTAILKAYGETTDWTYMDPLNTPRLDVTAMKMNGEPWLHKMYIGIYDNWILSSDIDNLIRVWNTGISDSPTLTFAIRTNQHRPLSIHFNYLKNTVMWCSLAGSRIARFGVDTPTSILQPLYCSAGCGQWTLTGDRLGAIHVWDGLQPVVEIPLWFPVYAIDVELGDAGSNGGEMRVIAGGMDGNLVHIRIKTSSMDWKLDRIFESSRKSLIAKRCIIAQSLHLTDWSTRVLQSHGAIGVPSPQVQEYRRLNQLLNPLPSANLAVPTLFGVRHFLDEIWTISIASRKPRTWTAKCQRLLGVRHQFLVLQGRLDGHIFATRIDLKRHPTTGLVVHNIKPYASIEDYEQEGSTCERRHWEVSAKCGTALLRNVRRDQQQEWVYDFLVHNCVRWCTEHLTKVGVPVTYWQVLKPWALK